MLLLIADKEEEDVREDDEQNEDEEETRDTVEEKCEEGDEDMEGGIDIQPTEEDKDFLEDDAEEEDEEKKPAQVSLPYFHKSGCPLKVSPSLLFPPRPLDICKPLPIFFPNFNLVSWSKVN